MELKLAIPLYKGYSIFMNIVAFDPSLIATGVWIDKKKESLTIRTNQNHSRFQRLSVIMKRVAIILKEEKPDVVVVEGYAYGMSNSRSVTVQAEVGGIIRALATTMGAYVVEIAPMQWKSVVMGKNMIRAKKNTKIEKALYIGVAQAISKERFTTCDEADAYMMARYFKEAIKGMVPETDAFLRMKKRLVADNVV